MTGAWGRSSVVGAPTCALRIAALLVALSAGGCNAITTQGQQQVSLANASGVAVSFESIEGPPAPVVNRLMNGLSEEAAAYQIAVLPKSGTPLYRIRGYLAYAPDGNPSISYAWDIYDTDQRHSFRVTGAEPSTARRTGAWASDEQAIRSIARASMEQLATFIAATRTGASTALAYAPTRE